MSIQELLTEKRHTLDIVDIFLNPPTPNKDVQNIFHQPNLVFKEPPHPTFGQCLKFCSFFIWMALLTELTRMSLSL